MVTDLSNKPPAVAVETHGCKLNQADSFKLGNQFKEFGYIVVAPEERIDVYVLNSCTVTHVADAKARQRLRAIRRLHPDATIVATGCYAENSPAALSAMKEVDLVIGNSGKDDLVRQIVESTDQPYIPCATGSDSAVLNQNINKTRSSNKTRAMVKIQEGCNQICAYCIVPKVRGREISISPDAIIAEINELESQGYQEIVLTGTQLGSYGFDLPNMSMTQLLESILLQTSVPRIRVSSLQPQDIGPDMLNLWSDHRLCPHFHIPLQSGSDVILKRMRRRYSSTLYSETVKRINETIDGVAITSDILVGFPGETEVDYSKTLGLCEELQFAQIHVFPYSVRPGTSASYFSDKVPKQTKTKRVRQLITLGQEHGTKFKSRFLGQVRDVLWEEKQSASGNIRWGGLTDNYIRVHTTDPKPLSNKITKAKLGTVDGTSVLVQNT